MKKILINTIIIFMISVLIYGTYHYLPLIPTAIFFPLNDSLWEGLKLVFTSYMIFIIFKLLFFRKTDRNIILNYLISAIINMIILLIVFIPFHFTYMNRFIFVIIFYLLSIFLSTYIVLKLKLDKKIIINKYNFVILTTIFGIYLILDLFTFIPINYKIFISGNNTKGIHYKIP
jgi:hypothetical protein